jgi:Dolichyl-phosphate-mannose-protein mannosyltransferase
MPVGIAFEENSPAGSEKSSMREKQRGRLIIILLCFLLLYVALRGLAGAATNGFWFDEMITSSVASQPSMKAVWAALATGVDGQPPGFYVVERAASASVAKKEIALRLPSIVAFLFTLVCIFVYVRRRNGEVVAFLCACLLLSTVLFQRYATEARPYALVVACFAFALVCYQRLPSVFWTVLFGVSLVLAQSFHHYSLFAMVPFGLAEAVVLWREHKFRWGVWLALILGPVPLLFFWPLLAQVKTLVGGHFQVKYSLTSIPSTYGEFFLVDSGYGAALAAICIAGVVRAYFWPRQKSEGLGDSRAADLTEGTLLVSLVGLPLIALSVVKVMHGAMRSSYVIVLILGVCLAIACMLTRARPWAVALLAVFLLFDVGLREYKFWRSADSFRFVEPTVGLAEFLQGAGYGDSDMPVVVASGMVYTPLAYYSAEPLKDRLFYLTDEKKELELQGSDSFDKNVKLLQKYTPLQIRDCSDFTSANPVFLLYGEDPGYGDSWLAQYLVRQGYSVQAIATDATRRLFLVNMRIKMGKEAALWANPR